jgi:aspartyl-tRNA(Asn)/glutamyl-tRNA(Gln) amidotransferase subunit B
LVLSNEILEQLNNEILEIPYQIIKNFKEFWFHKEYINAIIADKEILDYFLFFEKKWFDPKTIAKRIVWPISAWTKENYKSINELSFNKEQFQKFLVVVKDWKILENQLKVIIDEMLKSGKNAEEIIKEKWFDVPAIDQWELENIVKLVLEENPETVQQYKWWKTTTLWFFVWQVMKKTWWKSNPKVIWEIVIKLLN